MSTCIRFVYRVVNWKDTESFHEPVPAVELLCQDGMLCEIVAKSFQTGDVGCLNGMR